MLIIQSLNFHIAVSSKESYAIYTNDYFLDEDGNLVTDIDRTDVYEYGDIIIQTPSTKYIIKKVYSAYEYAADMIRYIGEHHNDDVIFIDMSELHENWEDQNPEFAIEVL